VLVKGGTVGTTTDVDGRFSLRFEDAKRLSGRGGCNRYSASCDAEAGGHLRVGPIASTRMTCPEAQRERAFFAMLRSAVRYELDAKMLILSDSIGVRAVFQAAEEDQNTKNQKIN
jgi:heat shock protein HslJ